MLRCNNCGREVEGEGSGVYTTQYGFICFTCSDALHMTACVRCGQRFPFSQMVEAEGDMYCKQDFASYKRTEKAKPQPKKKAGAAAAVRARPSGAGKGYAEPYEVENTAKRLLEGKGPISLASSGKQDTFSDLLGSLKRLIRGK